MKSLARGLILLAGLLLPNKADACVQCVTALQDYLLPPVYAWALVGPVWMLATGVLGSWKRARLPGGSPGLPGALVSVCGVLLVAGAALGLAATLMLGVQPAITAAIAVFGKPERFSDSSLRLSVQRLGKFATVVILGLAAYSTHIHMHRSKGEWMVRWKGSSIGNLMLKNGDAELSDYRYVIESDVLFIQMDAAVKGLEKVGTLEELRLLEKVIQDPRRKWSKWNVESMQGSADRLRERLIREGKLPNEE